MKDIKILIYFNRNKDPELQCLDELRKTLKGYGVIYDIKELDEKIIKTDYDAIFVVGGDGTLLRRTEFANRNGIPLIGINAGKLGFLTEFERSEIKDAVKLFIENQLVQDERTTLVAEFKDRKYYALNDVVVQRVYMDSRGMTVTVNVSVDSNQIDTICGDGVIVATPTGSTAYSLSAGGAILAPGINAFVITPLSAHSFNQRPVVYSSASECEIVFAGGLSGGILIDGLLVSFIELGDTVKIYAADKPTVFLRRKSFNFFKRLAQKFKDRTGGRI